MIYMCSFPKYAICVLVIVSIHF